MPYAKPCKYCNNVQVVWDEHLQGSNKYKEVQTNQPHTRERCDAAKITGVESYTPTPTQQQETFSPPKISESFDDVKIANLITKIDNMNIALAQIMSNVSNIIENTGTFKEMQELRTENQQLKETIKKEGMGLKSANQIKNEVQTSEEFDQHVRDMVQKGKKETENNEELEL